METSNNSSLGAGSVIFLIGFMGSGKSYWGNIWSQQSGLPFFDLDAVIEQQQQKTIIKIFEENGETFFRNLETAALHSFTSNQNCIIACGGGTPCFNNNMQWMNEHGVTVYLKAAPAEIITRVTGEQDKRPVIRNIPQQELHAFVEKKLAEREPFYTQAKYVLPVSSLTNSTITTLTTL